MEKQPQNKEFTPEEKAKARSMAEMILAESKAGKKNFPMGSPMSEKEFTEWYINNKERLAEIEKDLIPKERVKARARFQAEMLLAEARAGGQELKFPTTEKDWIDSYIEANVQMWRDSVAESRKKAKAPVLMWKDSKWSLVYDYDWRWGGDDPPRVWISSI